MGCQPSKSTQNPSSLPTRRAEARLKSPFWLFSRVKDSWRAMSSHWNNMRMELHTCTPQLSTWSPSELGTQDFLMFRDTTQTYKDLEASKARELIARRYSFITRTGISSNLDAILNAPGVTRSRRATIRRPSLKTSESTTPEITSWHWKNSSTLLQSTSDLQLQSTNHASQNS